VRFLCASGRWPLRSAPCAEEFSGLKGRPAAIDPTLSGQKLVYRARLYHESSEQSRLIETGGARRRTQLFVGKTRQEPEYRLQTWKADGFGSDEHVADGAQYTDRGAVVVVHVHAVQVAQCPLQPERPLLQDESLVPSSTHDQRGSKACLEGHVEPREVATGQLHARQVVHRVPTRLQQLEDAALTIGYAGGNLKYGSGKQSEAGKPRYQR
jgi:hypothetical protein